MCSKYPSLGHVEVRQVVLSPAQVDIAPLGDPHRVADGLGELAPEGPHHLVAGLQVELVAVIAKAVAVVDVARRSDAQQDVVRDVIAVSQVVHVVGGDQRQR